MNDDTLIYDWNQDAAGPRPVAMLDDETLRDGLQSPSVRTPSIDEKIEILHRMDALRIDTVDIGLPGVDGIECTRQIRKHSPSIPIVMLTVNQSNDRIFEAICAGASGYLRKSEPSEAIVRGLETALDDLAEWVHPAAEEIGAAAYLSVPSANAAERQLARYEAGAPLREIYAEQVLEAVRA